jgi:hypothetical protein
MKKTRLLLLLALLMTAATGAWATDDETVFELNGSTASTGTLTLGTSSVEAATVKIHNNKDGIPAIKFSSSYNYADGKYFTIKPATGSFKKGDKLSIAVCFNNADNEKEAKAAIYADDHTTLLYTTANGINGRTNETDDPAVEEYVLTQDAAELYIGRKGNTATFVTTLKVVRPAASGSGSGDAWTDIIINGDLEGTDLQCFFAKEHVKCSEIITFATVVDGVGKDGSRAIEVQSSGNEVNDYDTQFFIRLPYELPAGTKYRLTFDYKADNPNKCSFESHNEPGEYIVWYIGEGQQGNDFYFPTDWETYDSGELSVPSDANGSQNGDYKKNFQTVSVSMSIAKKATKYIIDNIKFEVLTSELSGLTPHPYMEALIAKAQALVDAGGDAEAVGKLQAAIATAKGIANPTFDDILALQAATDQFQKDSITDIIINGDLEGTDLQCFFAKEDGKGSDNITFATVVDGVGKNGSRAIVVQSSGNEVNNWDTQFFIRLPYVLPKGTKYKVSFDYKANKASHCYLQICNEPGEYVHWSMSKPNRDFNWDFGTDWNTMYSGEMTVPDECDGSQNAGGYLNNFQTISFSMGVTKEATEFIIDNIKVEVLTSALSGLTSQPYIEALIAKAQALVDAGGDAEAVGNLQAAIATAKGIANPTFDDILALQAAIDQFQQTITAIISIKDDKVESATYYDLSGRKLQKKPTVNGVYIVNGKKVVIK